MFKYGKVQNCQRFTNNGIEFDLSAILPKFILIETWKCHNNLLILHSLKTCCKNIYWALCNKPTIKILSEEWIDELPPPVFCVLNKNLTINFILNISVQCTVYVLLLINDLFCTGVSSFYDPCPINKFEHSNGKCYDCPENQVYVRRLRQCRFLKKII